jgi:hypothetical protein
MDHCTRGHEAQPLSSADPVTEARLTAIETHLKQLEELLTGVGQFNNRLDQVHAKLELALGFLMPEPAADPTSESHRAGDHPDHPRQSLRVITHLSREGQGARLVAPMAWSDMWSVRLFVAGLLCGLARSGLPALGCRCWCEVWNPDQTGELVDSAFLDPDTGAIEWESDLLDPRDDS